MLVKEVMKPAIGVDKTMTLISASEIMSDKDISSLVVVEGEKIIGIVTHDDMIDNFGEESTVEEIMTKKVITVGAEDSVDDAAELLKKKKISVLPVVEEEKLVGVVTARDLIGNKEEEGSEDFLMG